MEMHFQSIEMQGELIELQFELREMQPEKRADALLYGRPDYISDTKNWL